MSAVATIGGVVGICWLSLVNGHRGLAIKNAAGQIRFAQPTAVDGPVTARAWMVERGCVHVRDTIEFGDRWQYFDCSVY